MPFLLKCYIIITTMSKVCAICGKEKQKAGKWKKIRGQYNPSKTRNQKPNLQKATLPNGEKALVCTKCLKKLYKE